MNQFAATANLMIRLGPGVFTTKGYADGVAGGWQAKPGMKILGSGVAVTKLQLSGVTQNGVQYFVVGHDLATANLAVAPVDAFEISDLEIDCGSNIAATSAYGAIRIMGSHARIRRVRATNWGTRDSTKQCYVFSLITAIPNATPNALEAVNTGIEDCYAITPGTIVAGGKVTIINVGGHDNIGFPKELHAKSPFIRNCYVDCGVTTPDPDPATAKFRGLAMGWCRGGVVEGNQVYNTDIAGPFQDQRSVRDIIVRNNFFKNVACGPFFDLGQASSALTGTPTISWVGSVGTVNGLNTGGMAYLGAGDRVALATNQASVTGVYAIQNVTATTFEIVTKVASPPATTITSVKKLLSVGRATVEGNTIEVAPSVSLVGVAFQVDDNNGGGTPYVERPDYAHGDIIFRNNKVRYVDGVFKSTNLGFCSDVRGAKNLQVQNNVVDCAPANPLRNSRCGAATYFNDLTPLGLLVQGYNAETAKKYDELATLTEDAFVMAYWEQ
ncbi:MAG: hypothetical protein JNN07_19945 [Verrucomicrobiales bacterium]|nr:hypothetical protein [Verrucomicrobiales bacterium]